MTSHLTWLSHFFTPAWTSITQKPDRLVTVVFDWSVKKHIKINKKVNRLKNVIVDPLLEMACLVINHDGRLQIFVVYLFK